jgi:hypothetical protein
LLPVAFNDIPVHVKLPCSGIRRAELPIEHPSSQRARRV